MTNRSERAAILEVQLFEARRRYVEVFRPLHDRFHEEMRACHDVVTIDADGAEAEIARDQVRIALRACSEDPELVEAGATLARLEDERRRLLVGASTSPDHQRGPTC
jgi:hypothetical protein